MKKLLFIIFARCFSLIAIDAQQITTLLHQTKSDIIPTPPSIQEKARTPFHYARERVERSLAQVLIPQGSLHKIEDNDCETPLHKTSCRPATLYATPQKPYDESEVPPNIKMFVAHDALINKKMNIFGQTPLHLTICITPLAVIHCLMGLGPDAHTEEAKHLIIPKIVDLTVNVDSATLTLLMIAILHEQPALARFLLQARATVHAQDMLAGKRMFYLLKAKKDDTQIDLATIIQAVLQPNLQALATPIHGFASALDMSNQT